MTNELESKTTSLSIAVNNLIVSNDTQNQKAVELVKIVKSLQDEISNTFDPIVEKAHSAHKEAIKQRDSHIKPLKDHELKIKQLISSYLKSVKVENERLARLQEEKKKSLEDEALRLIQSNHDGEINDNDIDVVIDSLIDDASSIVTTPKPVYKVPGISQVVSYNAVVIDELIIPREYLCVDLKKINKVVRAFSGKIQIPGIDIKEEINIRA